MTGISLPLAFFDFVNAPAWAKPFWPIAWGGIVAVVALAVLFALLQLVFPKIAAIAWTTGKEALLQPLFYILLFGGIFLLLLSLYLPYFTFGEDTKVVEENGLTLVMLLSVILGLWTASVSLAEEIEGRTASRCFANRSAAAILSWASSSASSDRWRSCSSSRGFSS